MITRSFTKGDAPSEAIYSPCEKYRYALTRIWQPGGRKLHFVMLNPSTATEMQNDPTVERCERRARTLGFGQFRVSNIFAWRDTDPRALKRCSDPVGPHNDEAIRQGLDWGDMSIAAWGTHGTLGARDARVKHIFYQSRLPIYVLGLTKDGHPRHPLYLAYTQQPILWEL